MRQVLLVVLIVGAAFAGGALVNGPALQWAQARLLDYMGLRDGGEIPSVDSPAGAAAGPQSSAAAAPAGKGSAAKPEAAKPPGPVPPPAPSTSPASPPPTPTTPPQPAATPPAEGPAPAGPGTPVKKVPRSTGEKPGTPAASPAPSGGRGDEASGPPPAPLDPSIGPALLAAISPPPEPGTTARADAPADSIPLEIAPSTSMDPRPATHPSSPATPRDDMRAGAANLGGPQEGWAAIRQKLRDLGVSRYTIEGTPGGRVNFSCLIPLAGRQAVSQRFEAEGDDEFQAAQATIRRITLWRASRRGADSP
ncbi:hypothetical protein OJF2_00940 [Aquisphaera giovannonii]|uniref:Uncharacterized protein n=1 Tax=Aquisphaera giovannonii TaxID=406548 RepID=A0A5B9VU74_9BACT|nr:hypothetical protein [Aquisphaera giovannonii]QEH31629.1 hypothetical protein OJF2_00940 [Aquisphaera giovannonii]